jgi:hypothetical protein
MSNNCLPPLASIEAVRPVFLIVMGVFLMLIAWRLAKTSTVWTGRILIAGALLLGFGYAVMMPMYEAGALKHYSPKAIYHGGVASVLAWQAVKLVVMNAGWLLFGTGVAMHAGIFGSRTPLARRAEIRSLPSHESIA